MNAFTTLYDLALSILAAPPDSPNGQLTSHHCSSHQEAEAVLRIAILHRTMPGEDSGTHWGILRIFMRNLVNRAQAPLPPDDMLTRLDRASAEASTYEERCTVLIRSINDNRRLSESLAALLDPQRAPNGARDYTTWLSDRIAAYAALPVSGIDPIAVLTDLDEMATNARTKVPNMGIALAANLLADLGVRSVAKPDLHVLPTMRGLLGRPLTQSACIKEVIHVAQREEPEINGSPRFEWLTGGLYPRDVDRIIYLIGSDNFLLNGRKKKREAPRRRELMLSRLLHSV